MTGIIILAAGSSSRLGQPKQNLVYQGKTLLQHAADAALQCPVSHLVIVTGANDHLLKPVGPAANITRIYNRNWQEGISSSIREGVRFFMDLKDGVSSVILMLCDQPFVDSQLLQSLIHERERTGKGIVASAYGNTYGPPALFDHKYFSTLLLLTGSEGAKKLFSQYRTDLTFVNFSRGVYDIDTIEDYKDLESLESRLK